jgi:methionyl-tRNA formyltransferase
VVSAPPRPAGRGLDLRPTPIAEEAAERLGIGPILQPKRLRDPEALATVLALRPELAVLVDYGQLVPAPILDLPLGALNLHPSLLPRHRGATPIPAAILAGDRRTGVTLIRMDAGLDSGPVVASTVIALDGSETAPELERTLAPIAAELLGRSLGPWIRGELAAVAQPEAGVSLTRRATREDGRLAGDRTASQAERMIRALQPWPGTFLETTAGRLVVLAGSVAPTEDGDAPGRIVADGEGLALVMAGGRLRLDRVQPPGGRPMTGPQFRRGRGRDLIGLDAV